MKFTCLKENLAKGLSVVGKAVPANHSFPILTNVLIVAQDGRLKLAGTNLNTSITVYIGASVDEEGSITVPAKLLSEFVSNLNSETVTFEVKDEALHLEAGKTKSIFNGMSANDFPDLPEVDTSIAPIELDGKVFASALSKVGFSVAADDTRPVFSGILLSYSGGKLFIVGSDGFRLSEAILDVNHEGDDFSIVLPARTLLEASRVLGACSEPVKMYVSSDKSACIFECEDILIETRMIDGAYPDYKRIIPEEVSIAASFSPADLLEAVKLTHVFVKGADDSAIRLVIDPEGVIKIGASSSELGSNASQIDAEIQGTLAEPLKYCSTLPIF
jgi:DNA polymerase III subunit beta